MSTSHYLLLGGIVVTVTGVIALAHYFSRTRGKLPDFLRNDTLSPHAELIVATMLVVIGLPLLVVAITIG